MSLIPSGATVAVQFPPPFTGRIATTRGGQQGATPIYLADLAPRRRVGESVTLITGVSGATTGAASLSPYRVYIAGVDRTGYVRRQESIQINLNTGSTGTASFRVNGWGEGESEDIPSQYVPQGNDSVEIRNAVTGALMFRGFIDTTVKDNASGRVSLRTNVNCVDFGVICDRRVVYFVSGTFWHNAPADSIITQIVNQFLAGTGITFIYSSNVNVILGDQSFKYVTAAEALNSIAQQTKTNRFIDAEGNLRFYSLTGGTTAAPETINDANTKLEALKITETGVRFANRWYAKSNQNLGNAVQVDTYTQAIAGWTGFLLTQAGPTAPLVPTVTVNGIARKVIPMPSDYVQPNNTTWDFVYIGLSVVYNWRLPALAIGDVIRISYPSPFPFVAIAEDATSIATVGLVEAIIEAGAIYDKATLQDIADEALARGKEIPVSLEIRTRTDGYQPGQILTVNRTKLGINDDFIVNSVSARLAGNKQWHYQITATNKATQLAGDPAAFASALIEGMRSTTYNIIERITFNLAVTDEGRTNPGLTTVPKKAIKTAQKDGTAGWVTLIFHSLSQLGAVTTTDIVIDILQNGVSIFGANLLTYPAGKQNLLKVSQFASNPLLVKKDDVFTCNVISADPLAMDGIMELVTVG